jgi:hypothetical protein
MKKKRSRALLGALAGAVAAGLSADPALAVTGGAPVPAGTYGFAAKIEVGDAKSCSGVLVAPRWVLTVKTCFAAAGQTPTSPPAVPTTATVGRTDLTKDDGHVLAVDRLAPHADRNLVLAHLAKAAKGVTPIQIATSPPTVGATIRMAGYGRTATEWIPDQLHAAAVPVKAVSAGAVELGGDAGGPAACKGDSGGPVFGETTGPALLAIVTGGWQGGCLGEPETRRGTTAVRVDDVAGWIATTAVEPTVKPPVHSDNNGLASRWADFDGDGNVDYLLISPSGAVRAYLNRGGNDKGGWEDAGQVAVGLTADHTRVQFADFDGDSKADYIHVKPNGPVEVFLNRGGDTGKGWETAGQVAAGLTTDHTRVQFADFDGDSKADYIHVKPNGPVEVFLNRGGDTGKGWETAGHVAAGLTTDHTRVRFADFDGDRKADYILRTSDGTVGMFLNRGGDTGNGWESYGNVVSP